MDVQAGSMLTTEQVYALMRGDVESATPQEQNEQQVADPFPTPMAQPPVTAPAFEVTSTPAAERKIPVAKDEDWQSWDAD